jgi:hypothetical protein
MLSALSQEFDLDAILRQDADVVAAAASAPGSAGVARVDAVSNVAAPAMLRSRLASGKAADAAARLAKAIAAADGAMSDEESGDDDDDDDDEDEEDDDGEDEVLPPPTRSSKQHTPAALSRAPDSARRTPAIVTSKDAAPRPLSAKSKLRPGAAGSLDVSAPALPAAVKIIASASIESAKTSADSAYDFTQWFGSRPTTT